MSTFASDGTTEGAPTQGKTTFRNAAGLARVAADTPRSARGPTWTRSHLSRRGTSHGQEKANARGVAPTDDEKRSPRKPYRDAERRKRSRRDRDEHDGGRTLSARRR